jgi:hypothetical protein
MNYSTPDSYIKTFILGGTAGPVSQYRIYIAFNHITETLGTGLGKPDAKPGDAWSGSTVGSHVYFIWQMTSNNWKQLDVYGLVYSINIYNGYAVNMDAYAQLNTTDKVSSFIIPLHDKILNSMSTIESTQVATISNNIIFNCYVEKKQPWYADGFFQIILVAVTVVLSVATFCIADVGLLGSGLAIGTLLGFEGTTAAIVGAAANALAAVIFIQVVQIGAVSIFGAKLGVIIGAIASFLALQVGTVLVSGTSLLESMNSLLRVDNLIKLTESVGKGVTDYAKAEIDDLVRRTQDLVSLYKSQENEINTKWHELTGTASIINPLSTVDVTVPDPTPQLKIPSETPQSFLDRTLMVGSDIADLSFSMINRYTDIMLNRELVQT